MRRSVRAYLHLLHAFSHVFMFLSVWACCRHEHVWPGSLPTKGRGKYCRAEMSVLREEAARQELLGPRALVTGTACASTVLACGSVVALESLWVKVWEV